MRAFEHFPNLVAMFFARAAEKGDAPFLWAKSGGEWHSTSWRGGGRAGGGAGAGAAGRSASSRGDLVMLVSENRPEWCIADLAIMAAGCVTVPAYTTNTERDHQHILDDSGARAAIVSTQKLARALLPAAQRTSRLRACHLDRADPGRPDQQYPASRLVGSDRRRDAERRWLRGRCRFRPRRSRLPHLHVRHGRRAARGDAAARRHPPQCRRLHRRHRHRFRLGRRGIPVLPAR